MKKTKIIATIGPASEDIKILEKMINNGMNIARLNFSHGNYEEHGKRISAIRTLNKKMNKKTGILIDTKGPEIRTLDFINGSAELKKGNTVIVTTEKVAGTAKRFSVSYVNLNKDLKKGAKILLDDGLIELTVMKIAGKDLTCKINNSGKIKNKKGVNVPGSKINFKFMSAKDKADIEFACDQKVDYLAASFVRNAKDIAEIRKVIKNKKNSYIKIMAKIECQEGVENIDEIIAASDAIMVARGDLGVEINVEDVPFVQKNILLKCLEAGVPSVTATQMLESMQVNPRPTRAEVNDVTNAIIDGSDAVMLSGETAAGLYPVESVAMQNTIASKVESETDYSRILRKVQGSLKDDMVDLISYAAVNACNSLDDIKLIITPTTSGFTPKTVSRMRPKRLIFAVTPDDRITTGLSNY